MCMELEQIFDFVDNSFHLDCDKTTLFICLFNNLGKVLRWKVTCVFHSMPSGLHMLCEPGICNGKLEL